MTFSSNPSEGQIKPHVREVHSYPRIHLSLQFSRSNGHLLTFRFPAMRLSRCAFAIAVRQADSCVVMHGSSYNVTTLTAPKSGRTLTRCDGSWDFSERPICTMPNPRSISPMARISANMNVERLLITASGSLAAYARSAPTVKISTSSIYTG